MILIYISLGLAFITAVALSMANRTLSARLNEAKGFIDAQNRRLEEYAEKEEAHEFSLMSEAEVEERTYPVAHFVVYRTWRGRVSVVLRVGFNPDDPDDKEYRRIHAKEVAEKLNEKP